MPLPGAGIKGMSHHTCLYACVYMYHVTAWCLTRPERSCRPLLGTAPASCELCILGTYLGIWKLLELMAIAWIAVALAAVAVLALHKCRRGAALPMVPFITAGYIVMWVGELFQ